MMLSSQLKHISNHRTLFDTIAFKLHITKFEDWFTTSTELLKKKGAGGVLTHYNNSLFKALSTIYSEFEWNPRTFARSVPQHHWKQIKNQRELFDYIAVTLGVEKQEDWYLLKGQSIKKLAGGLINDYYNNSIYEALSSIYPEFVWNQQLFLNAPKKLWTDWNQRRKLFDELSERFGIEASEQWYQLTGAEIAHYGAQTLLIGYYNGSLCTALKNVYPEYEWDALQFKKAPHGLWKTPQQCREFMDRISDQLNITKQEDWYRLSGEVIDAYGGLSIMSNYHQKSLWRTLRCIYPEYDWIPWFFRKVTHKYWNDQQNRKNCLKWMEERLGISSILQWTKKSNEDVLRVGGSGLLSYYNYSLLHMLKSEYPNENWSELQRITSEGQSTVESILKHHLSEEVFTNYKIYDEDRHCILELDVYIPSLSLALEYQGEMHYDPHYYQGSIVNRQNREEQKQAYCNKMGITLIDIPYWWHNNKQTLLTSIHNIRPDIRFVNHQDD
jgi:hypothetical protein